MLRVLFFLTLTIAILVHAWLKGGAPERWGATSMAIALGLSASLGIFDMPGEFTTTAAIVALTDIVLAISLTALAILANRIWPILAAACQWATVLGHMVKLMDPQLIPIGYAFVMVVWSWPTILSLLFGTIAHRQRRHSLNYTPPWKDFSHRSELMPLPVRAIRFLSVSGHLIARFRLTRI